MVTREINSFRVLNAFLVASVDNFMMRIPNAEGLGETVVGLLVFQA